MAAQGSTFDTPRACPFVALELDRDRRSDTPDYRHRCFAEPTPAPRSIAHQEAYCLSPNFPACPVFQDWAVRAAARPVASGNAGAATVSGAALVGGAAAASAPAAAADPAAGATAADGAITADATTPPPTAAVDATWAASAAQNPFDDQRQPQPQPQPQSPSADDAALVDLPEDASVTPAGAEIAAAAAAATGIASPPTFATTWEDDARESEQLGAFDASAADSRSSYEEPEAIDSEPAASAAFVPPPAPPQSQYQPPAESERDAAAAAVPAFLAGRSTRPAVPATDASGSNPPPRPASATRDDIVPSWDIDGRYGAEPQHDPRAGGGSRLDGILTAIAVIAILALGVAAVLFLPGLLSKGKPPTTPAASAVVATARPSSPASANASPVASTAVSLSPTVAPTTAASVGPVASQRLYKIKAGDSLARIANRFGLSIQDILAANPDITNPNAILVGQVIVIPVVAQPSAAP
jgi:LysM repeat protein